MPDHKIATVSEAVCQQVLTRADAFTANEGDYFFMQECIAENLAETAGAWFN